MTGQYPRLRHHTRVRKGGRVVVYYSYDRRPEGLSDIPLGRDYDQALKKWREIHERAPRIAGTLLEAFEAWERDVLPRLKPVTARDYRLCLKQLKVVLGPASWDRIDFPTLKKYLRQRSAPIRANHEMRTLRAVWNWARGEGFTALPWPAAGLEKSRWMNPETPRKFEVTDDLFAAVYAQSDQVLRDCMDLSSATGMRLTDCRTILMPRDGVLRLKASKTGKLGEFDVSASVVLTAIVERRKTINADHLMLLSTPQGSRVSVTMLRDRYEAARARAVAAADADTAVRIKAMQLSYMRKRAADLAGDESEAQELLQHSDRNTTRRHYRTKAAKLRPVR